MMLGFLLARAAAGLEQQKSHDKSGVPRQRDLGTVQTALGAVNAALAQLDSALVKNEIGLSLLPLSTNVLVSIQNATVQVQNSSPLSSITDVSDLKATTDGLTANVNTTIGDLIRNQSGFKKLGSIDQVLFVLQMLKTNAIQLAQMIASQVPAELMSVAAQAVQNLEATIDRGIAVFNGSSSGTADGASTTAAPLSSSLFSSTQGATTLISSWANTGTPSLFGSTPKSSVAVSRPTPMPQPTASNTSNASIPQNPMPPSGSFGGVSVLMPVPGTFVPGQTCLCVCPAIAQLGSNFLLVGP